jgi:hypothetical protein
MGLFFLTACNSNNQASNSNTNPAASATEASKSAAVTPTTETKVNLVDLEILDILPPLIGVPI